MFNPNQLPPLNGQVNATAAQPGLQNAQQRWQQFFAQQGRPMPSTPRPPQQMPQLPQMLPQQAPQQRGSFLQNMFRQGQQRNPVAMREPVAPRSGFFGSRMGGVNGPLR